MEAFEAQKGPGLLAGEGVADCQLSCQSAIASSGESPPPLPPQPPPGIAEHPAPPSFLRRAAASALMDAALRSPVLSVSGPMYSGKTTLCRALFPRKPWVSLDDPDPLEMAARDPRAFLELFPDGAGFHEIQRCPSILPYLRERVAEDPRPGLFVLTSSHQLCLGSGVPEHLGPCQARFELLPLSLGELQAARRDPESLDAMLFRGFFPSIHAGTLDPAEWYGSYVRLLTEREARRRVNVRDPGAFRQFLQACAGWIGRPVNFSALARDCGVTHNTAVYWMMALEQVHLVHRIPPRRTHFGGRQVRTDKLYFHDTGLAAWLLGIREEVHLRHHPLRGSLFECWVANEVLKDRCHRGMIPDLFFWRDRRGRQVDLLVNRGACLLPIDARVGQTVNRGFFRSMEEWRALAGASAGPGQVVYGGRERTRRGGTRAVPWREFPLETL